MTHFADDATLARLVRLEVVAEAAEACNPETMYTHHRVKGGRQKLTCRECNSCSVNGRASVVHSVDCGVGALDAALARLRALDAGGEA